MKMPVAPAITLLLLCAANASGSMEEIVVTATRSEKLVRTNPYSISVLNEDQLRGSTHDQLADVIGDLPGVFVSDAGQAGQKRVRIRGEEARRVTFLIDGQEFIDHREVGVPLLVGTSNIKRIEVVRGPASVLYGSKALGGVINVITTRDHDAPLAGRFSAGYNGAASGDLYAGRIGGHYEQTDWQLGFSDNSQDLRKTPQGDVENTRYESSSYMARVNQSLGAHTFGVGYEKFESSSDVYVAPEERFAPPLIDFRIDIPVRDRDKVRLDYQVRRNAGSLESVKVDAYRQTSDREFNTFPSLQLAPGLVLDTAILTISQLVSDGINLQTNWGFDAAHGVVAGYQYLHDEVDQTRDRTVRMNGIVTVNQQATDVASQQTHAVYLLDDWSVTERLSLLSGARLYTVKGTGGYTDEFAIASLAIVYDFNDQLTGRLNVSQGYIYPSLLNLSIGAFAGSRYVNPDPLLKPEKSVTTELGLRFAGNDLILDSTVFVTSARDYIDHEFCTAADNCLTPADKIYKNTGEAKSFGLELLAEYQIGWGWVYANATWLKRRKSYEGVDTYQSGLPEQSGRVGLRAMLLPNTDVDIFGRFESVADELAPGGTTVRHNPGFVTLNINMEWKIVEGLDISLSAENLFDKSYSPATENLLAPGRHLRARLSYEF